MRPFPKVESMHYLIGILPLIFWLSSCEKKSPSPAADNLAALQAAAESDNEQDLGAGLVAFEEFLAQNPQLGEKMQSSPQSLAAIVAYHNCLEEKLELLGERASEKRQLLTWQTRFAAINEPMAKLKVPNLAEAKASIVAHLKTHEEKMKDFDKALAAQTKTCDQHFLQTEQALKL